MFVGIKIIHHWTGVLGRRRRRLVLYLDLTEHKKLICSNTKTSYKVCLILVLVHCLKSLTMRKNRSLPTKWSQSLTKNWKVIHTPLPPNSSCPQIKFDNFSSPYTAPKSHKFVVNLLPMQPQNLPTLTCHLIHGCSINSPNKTHRDPPSDPTSTTQRDSSNNSENSQSSEISGLDTFATDTRYILSFLGCYKVVRGDELEVEYCWLT